MFDKLVRFLKRLWRRTVVKRPERIEPVWLELQFDFRVDWHLDGVRHDFDAD